MISKWCERCIINFIWYMRVQQIPCAKLPWHLIQDDQKVSVNLMITIQKQVHKDFSITMYFPQKLDFAQVCFCFSANPSLKIIMQYKCSSATTNIMSTKIFVIDHLWLYYALWLLDIVFGMPLSGVTWPLIWLGEADQLNHLHKAVKMIWFLTFGLTHSPKKKCVKP